MSPRSSRARAASVPKVETDTVPGRRGANIIINAATVLGVCELLLKLSLSVGVRGAPEMLKKILVRGQLGINVLELVLSLGDLIHGIDNSSTRAAATGSDIGEEVSSRCVDVSGDLTRGVLGQALLDLASGTEDVQLGRCGHIGQVGKHKIKDDRCEAWKNFSAEASNVEPEGPGSKPRPIFTPTGYVKV